MHRHLRTSVVIAAVVTAVAAGAVATGGAATASAEGATPTPASITVHMTKHQVRLSQSRVHAGTIGFRVISSDGRFHQLQIARLHKGYTLQQAQSDFGEAFSGNVPAIRRLDHRVSFRGGAPAHRSGYPGRVVIDLPAGRYYLFDQDGQGLATLRVVGTEGHQPAVPHQAMITANTYGFQATRLPASGWLKVRNVSDQPHFIAMTRVKDSTTRRMVARAASHPSNRKPSWLLHAGTDSSVISPYRHEILRYRLPAGKYLIACFWPDDDTGMPHFYMGMWRLVHVG
jgi:hypothetical protein